MSNYLEKYPLLISNQCCGSTWVQSYIRQAYLTNWKKTLSFSIANNDDEFLEIGKWTNFNSDINFKINFLKSLREHKFELCHKVMSEMLTDKNVLNWFIDFYKDHNIIILKRRNLWKALLSYLFHNTIRKTLDADGLLDDFDINVNKRPRNDILKENRSDILKSTIQTYNIKFKFDRNICMEYFESIRYTNTTIEHKLKHLRPQFLYMEDINTEFLQTRFKLPDYVSSLKPLKLKYHLYFKPKELEKMKQFFESQYENEFKFYGYKYTY